MNRNQQHVASDDSSAEIRAQVSLASNQAVE